MIGIIDENVHMSPTNAAFVQKRAECVLEKSEILGSAEGQIQKTMVDRLEFHGDFPAIPPGGAASVARHAVHGCALLSM